jgi:hypothetical protein
MIAAPRQIRDLAKQDQVLASLGRDELADGVLVAAARASAASCSELNEWCLTRPDACSG